MSKAKVIQADCRDVLANLPDNSIDSIVTDPPYELGFMGKKWDGTGIAYDQSMWAECLRVLKPGGYALVFGGTRTYHRMACAIEDAGFEIIDSIDWIYASGFPKSHNISKAIDKKLGAERELIETRKTQPKFKYSGSGQLQEKWLDKNTVDITAAASPEAQQWDGWGTQLKPAHEPIVVARKPFKGQASVSTLLDIQLRQQGVTGEIEWA